MATRKRAYSFSMSERGGEPDARFFYQIVAADAVLAIRRAKKKAATDYCLDLSDIVIDEVTLDYEISKGGE